ncbi:hapless 2-like isoform X2 [Aquila chrysaetos chrysaetos]|uniref:hapless 2-like isoform X2 n=1 Tax=Aquila chrysaetos chrysaetos TaxID=223781 RepID=UPI001176E3A9|nr:hapless 2-like isoform X2 [Aquila chrysaetos chrysaetos]
MWRGGIAIATGGWAMCGSRQGLPAARYKEGSAGARRHPPPAPAPRGDRRGPPAPPAPPSRAVPSRAAPGGGCGLRGALVPAAAFVSAEEGSGGGRGLGGGGGGEFWHRRRIARARRGALSPPREEPVPARRLRRHGSRKPEESIYC